MACSSSRVLRWLPRRICLFVISARVYAQAGDAEVFHYREKGGLEVDAIVQRNDGRWAAFVEVKLGEGRVDDVAPSSVPTTCGR